MQKASVPVPWFLAGLLLITVPSWIPLLLLLAVPSVLLSPVGILPRLAAGILPLLPGLWLLLPGTVTPSGVILWRLMLLLRFWWLFAPPSCAEISKPLQTNSPIFFQGCLTFWHIFPWLSLTSRHRSDEYHMKSRAKRGKMYTSNNWVFTKICLEIGDKLWVTPVGILPRLAAGILPLLPGLRLLLPGTVTPTGVLLWWLLLLLRFWCLFAPPLSAEISKPLQSSSPNFSVWPLGDWLLGLRFLYPKLGEGSFQF